jgi:hypothetical protein
MQREALRPRQSRGRRAWNGVGKTRTGNAARAKKFHH